MPGPTHEELSEAGSLGLGDLGDAIDTATFEQILEMDDDDDNREFSSSIVFDFFDQANATFQNMETALQEQDAMELSRLGHFLKGSSATLGLIKVRDACEKIQNLGAGKDETGMHSADPRENLKKLGEVIVEAQHAFNEAERVLKRFYHRED